MSQVFLARHPAPVLHRPPRARAARVTLAAMETPVRLRVLPRDAFRAIGSLRRYEDRYVARGGRRGGPGDQYPSHLHASDLSQRLFAGEGGTWTVLRTEPDADGRWAPVPARAFVDFLAGRPVPERAERGIARAMARTPVAVPGASRDDVARLGGGLRDGEVFHDGRAGAPEALRAWLDRNVALVGDEVRVRCLGPLVVRTSLWHGDRVLETMAYGSDHPSACSGLPRHAEATGWPYGGWRIRGTQMMAGLDLAALAGVGRDDALAHFANVAPDEVASALDMLDHDVPDQAWKDRATTFRVRAMTGAVRPDEAWAVADLVEAALGHLGRCPDDFSGKRLVRWLADHARDVVRPLCLEMPGLDEDAEALASLGR